MECVAFLVCGILNPVSTISMFWNLSVYSLFVPNMDIATLHQANRELLNKGDEIIKHWLENGTMLPLWKIGHWQLDTVLDTRNPLITTMIHLDCCKEMTIDLN